MQGTLTNGAVAVKKLINTHIHENKFRQEVGCLIRAKHKNVVRFLGYCADTQGKMANYNGKFVMADVQQRLLCFEYLPRSLDVYITGTVMWNPTFLCIFSHNQRPFHLNIPQKKMKLHASYLFIITQKNRDFKYLTELYFLTL